MGDPDHENKEMRLASTVKAAGLWGSPLSQPDPHQYAFFETACSRRKSVNKEEESTAADQDNQHRRLPSMVDSAG